MKNRKREKRARRRCARRKAVAASAGGARALQALASSAIALPGVAGTAAAEGTERYVAEYNYSWYKEDDIDASKVSPGSETSRYEIHNHQFRVAAPIAGRFDMGLDVGYETMSGATPWYIIPDIDGNPIQVMTGATIEEARTDVSLNGTYHLDTGRATAAAGFSLENDYLAFNGSLSGERYFNEKNTTLNGGGGFSIDTIEPVDADTDPFRPSKENKQSFALFTGVSQVLGRSSVVNSTFNYQFSNGFLSDPYKRVLVGGAPVGDSRPDIRHQFTWLNRLRQYSDFMDGSFHLDYRFYADTWQITSHTIEAAWYQNLPWGLRLIPSLRYYTQSGAKFYAPFFEVAPRSGHASSDYRLSPFGALAYRLRAESTFPVLESDWKIHVGWERYTSSADLAIMKVAVENPGLVSYHLVSVGLTTAF
ncbi:MAG: DUF3570 domain-containing protein [Myxococcota bacterium]